MTADHRGPTRIEKITVDEVRELVARLAREPGQQAVVSQIRKFTPQELAERIAQRLKPTLARKPKQASTSARMKVAIKATKEAGMEAHRVEIDAEGKVSIVTGKPAEEPATEFDRWKAKKNARPT